jgi:hypothetical protein
VTDFFIDGDNDSELRKIDAEIAAMLGWHGIRFDESEGSVCGYSPDGSGSVRFNLHYYTLCANSAGFVVDWLAAKGYMVTVYTRLYRHRGIRSRCCVTNPSDLKVMVYTEADTRPLAICRAALEARERWGE